jgi:DNA polymerase, archaea type
MRSFLLDVVPLNDTNHAITVSSIQLILREEDNKIFFKKVDFSPFFYFDAKEFPEIVKDTPQIKKVEKSFKKIDGKEKELWKVVCYSQDDLKKLAELLFPFGKCYEFDIPYVKRFLSEMEVKVFTYLHYDELENDFIQIRLCEEAHYKLNSLAFDIETYNPGGNSNPKEDPTLMISYCDKDESKVITYRESNSKNSILVKDEKETIEEFKKTIRTKSIDVIYGYNSSQFDFPYLKERARKNNISLDIGRDNSDVFITTRGMIPSVLIQGRIHADVYQMVFFLARIGALKTNTYTLYDVFSETFKIKKKMVNKPEIWKMWDSDEMRGELVDYCMEDSIAAYKLGERFLPIFVELAKIVNLSLKDTLISTTGQMVESFIINEAIKRNFVIPTRPTGTEIYARDSSPIEGAYVKVPAPGVYDNIAVFDFRSLYPSIIVAHNVSPDTFNCSCCSPTESFISPEGHRFCKKKKGLIPEILRKILIHRKNLKKQLKEIDKESEEYVYTYARQYAFKILANSFYGMLGYVRARWYCKECAAATTAWERYFIKDVIKTFEEKGYNVLYSDTDSIFVLMEKRNKEEINSVVDDVNEILPEEMELELEDFYKRGLFVSKRGEGKTGAKKKYALLSESGSIKIRGFELVRRDWSGIARKTQKKILEIILKEGDVEKAVSVVQKTIDDLKEGKVKKKDLIINTVLRKKIDEYKTISPEVSASKKAIARGVKIREGQMIKYIITSKGDSTSEKAELVDFVKEKDYDIDYYIDKQVIPAVEKILGELGYDSSLIKSGKKQSGLEGWF